jgi:hypothetical protein
LLRAGFFTKGIFITMARVSSHWGIQDPRFSGPVVPTLSPVSYSPAAAQTYSTSDVLGGLISRDCNGAARTDTLPSAAALVEAMQGVQAGHSFEFAIKNTSGAANTLTLAAGAGGSTSGTMTVAQSNIKAFVIQFTNVAIGKEAYTVYSLGTSVF